MSRPQPPSQPYFESQPLRNVRWPIHEQLAAVPGYQPCACADCEQMGGAHNLALAKRHQIRLANEEAQGIVSMSQPVRSLAVGARLEAAIAFRESLTPQLQGRVSADFLDRWISLI